MPLKTREEPWVGTWRPHKPRGPIAALYGNPGPKYALPSLTGNHQHDLTKSKAPVFSFGARHKEHNTNCSPGPKYLLPSNISRYGQQSAPAFSIQSRLKELKLLRAPGPGKYSPERGEKLIFHNAPAFSLTGRSKDLSNNSTPGPAKYTLPPMLGPNTVNIPSAPSYTFSGRSETGSFLQDLKKTPGPASYKAVPPYIYGKKPPHYSMTGRNFPPDEATEKPGPGAYYPEKVTCTHPKAPSSSFGLRHSQYVVPVIVSMDK
ncbi:ciliary microtubule associated protein 1B-like [Leuresthes tenuis]|uniref:ciliary microtubule associated protein 1B-like n=1 Tax=Leuresthes tenuis TaxID=355514 RepID=UPI003B506401